MSMMTHEQMIFCIQKIYPGTTHGVDYWVGHPSDPVTGVQTATAFVVQWNMKDAQPDEAAIAEQWAAHGAEYQAMVTDADGRAKRNALLVDADNLVEMALDTGNTALEASARAYRQALRDLPQNEGWPATVVWPDPPAAQSTDSQT
jgi:hypothetical protein